MGRRHKAGDDDWDQGTMLTESYFSATSDKPLVYETIGACFDRIAERHGERDGLIVRHQDIHWTYARYRTEVDRFAAGLLALGIGKGDRVGVWAPNCYEWCVTQFATAKIGAILVCINPAYRVYELEFALNKAGCKALVTAQRFATSDYAGMLRTLQGDGKLPQLRHIIATGEAPPRGMLCFADIAADPAPLAAIADTLSPDDAINIQFTSGTTGQPKGATLSHFNILNNGRIVGEGMRFTAEDRLCIPVPLYHCFGMVMGNLACVSHGAAAVFPNDGFCPVKTLEAVEAERCTALHGVPHHVHRRARASALRRVRPLFAAHRHHGGSAVPGGSHEAGAARDAHDAGPDRLRPDRDRAGQPPDRRRRSARQAGRDRRPSRPASGDQADRRGTAPSCPSAPRARSAAAAIPSCRAIGTSRPAPPRLSTAPAGCTRAIWG